MVLVIFSGFSIYYNIKLKNIMNDNNHKEEKLTELSSKLSTEEKKSKEIDKIIKINDKNVEFLEKEYVDLIKENHNLKTEKDILKQELDQEYGIGSCKASGSAECPN